MSVAVLPPRTKRKTNTAAARNRQAAARRSRANYAEIGDIGPIRAVGNPQRRARCQHDLAAFLVKYFPESSGLCPFSDDHLEFVARLQHCILHGGRQIDCVYRGFGKTTIAENACLWAALYGHKRHILILGADREAAEDNLDSVKSELSGNPLLAEDFPEVCQPIQALDGKPQRTHSQTSGGVLTKQSWTSRQIVLASIAGSAAAGVKIRTRSLLSCNRGGKHKSDGQQIRPDFVFIDDPQTDESARSPAQVAKRVAKLYKTVLMLAGHRNAMSVFIAATVIARDDFAHQLLDHERHPAIVGTRTPLIQSWAADEAHEKHWLGEYARLLTDFDRTNPDDQTRARIDATKYYRRHRKVMDDGARMSWKHCFTKELHEVSTTQHAYNILILNGAETVDSELQNDPREDTGDFAKIGAGDLAKKQTGHALGKVPPDTQYLTAGVDVQGSVLYWLAVAWKTDFTGHIVDFGIFPKQSTTYVKLATVKQTLRRRFPGTDPEGCIYAGLAELLPHLANRRWPITGDSGDVRTGRILVDTGYESETVKGYIRQCRLPSVVPCKGFGIRAKDRPISQWKAGRGCLRGREWIESRPAKTRDKTVNYDSNYWQSQIAAGLALPTGTSAAISLPRSPAAAAQMVADHCTAEAAQRVSTPERSILEWRCPPGADNHFNDCLKMAAVAASMLGCLRPGQPAAVRRRKKGRRMRKL